MTEDLRGAFMRADAALQDAPPSLEATIRQARRTSVVRRGVAAGSLLALVVAALVVLAVRPERSTIVPSGSGVPAVTACAEHSDSIEDVDAFINTFMDRRVNGSGAEDCVTTSVLKAYRAPGSWCLYACAETKVVGSRLATEITRESQSTWYATVIVQYSSGDDHTELIYMGAGESSTGSHAPLLVTDVKFDPYEGSLTPFVGNWFSHGATMVIDADGSVRIDYRTYTNCATDPQPCDTWKGSEIISGGHQFGHLVNPNGNQVGILIQKSNDPKTPVGTQLVATYDAANDGLQVNDSKTPGSARPFCGPKSPAGYCGA